MSKTTEPKPPSVLAAEAAFDAAQERLNRLLMRRGQLLAAVGRAGSAEWPRCINCPEADVRCLEAHHIAGKYDDTVVIVCRNCHRKLSDAQLDHPPWEHGAATRERFYGFADLLRLMADDYERGKL